MEADEGSDEPLKKTVLGFKRPANFANFKLPGRSIVTTKPESAVGSAKDTAPEECTRYFQVLYCKYQPAKKLRKNKTFNDGILEIKPGNKATLHNPDGKPVSESTLRGYTPSTLGEGSEIIMGGWELEVDSIIPAENFTSGKCFLKAAGSGGFDATLPTTGSETETTTAAGGGGRIDTNPLSNKPKLGALGKNLIRPFSLSNKPANLSSTNNKLPQHPAVTLKPVILHDPTAPTSILLNPSQYKEGTGIDPTTCKPISPVVVDPYLGRNLRPHQIEGVRFLYECVMGVRDPSAFGCILADDMGLGKTLQVLTLLWTLMKQGPNGRPAIHKALVVTPSSLTRNWAEEAKKWLGDERLRTMIISSGADASQQVLDFKHGQVVRVAIASYETVRKHASALAGVAGILIADEGHRLKSAQGNKTISALLSLKCPRRVLLTGTPVQNELNEFYAMVDFVNPEVLGSLSVFNRIFGVPIAKSRDKNASAEEKALGAERSRELSRRVATFVLRRTQEVNAAYLPPLSLYVVFCAPSPLQLQRLSSVLGSSSVRKMLNPSGADFGDQALQVLTRLRKICNHPALDPLEDEGDQTPFSIYDDDDVEEEDSSIIVGGQMNGVQYNVEDSGKLSVLSVLLDHILTKEHSRCVVVSQSTAMLDIIQSLCTSQGYTTVRIDGKTPVNKRQDIVNSFNSYNVGQVFLLSTTAGGAGLNLVGANRLVLVDSHWNPALDQQAMARIWRDKQKKPCTIYRLLTTGTLEEKIYQRQRAKGEIAAVTMGGATNNTNTKNPNGGGLSAADVKRGMKGQFSKEELRQLFTLNTNTSCDTADVLGRTVFQDVPREECADGPLEAVLGAGRVTFAHLERKEGGAITPISTAGEEDVQGAVLVVDEDESLEEDGSVDVEDSPSDLDIEDE